MKYYHDRWTVLVDSLNVFLLALVALVTFFPFFHVLAVSFASLTDYLRSPLLLWPERWSTEAYTYVFSSSAFTTSIYVSVYITVVGTLINLAVTSSMAYALSRRFVGQKIILLMVLLTLFFSGGLIPTYLVVKATGLIDTLWALMLPGAINSFNLIVLRQFFQGLPPELTEAAVIDGASDVQIFTKIALPLSKPALAAFALFYAVGHWNTFFDGILYLNNSDLWPIQVQLRQIVLLLSPGAFANSRTLQLWSSQIPPDTVQMAAIVIATLPILVVYPFLQKYFASGVLIGAIKS